MAARDWAWRVKRRDRAKAREQLAKERELAKLHQAPFN